MNVERPFHKFNTRPGSDTSAPQRRGSSTATGGASVRYRRWAALAAVTVMATGGSADQAAAKPRPVSSHAMVHSCCMDKSVKHLLFAESERMRATYIRVDVELHGIYGGAREHHRDWSKLRETLAVARQHPRVKVLGILVGTPLDLAEPCDRDRWWCPPSDPARYARLAAEVVRRARGTIDTWELQNEPCLYTGVGAERYAAMLRATYRAVKRAHPAARLVIGDPVAGCDSTRWLERVLTLAPRSFDIANLHLRGRLRHVRGELRRWRAVYARHGRGRAPVWVTEFGYSSTNDCQPDPRYRGGERAQARYLRDGLDGLTGGRAAQVFVTLRDNLDGCWLSEGLASIALQPPYATRHKPAFGTVRRWRPRK